MLTERQREIWEFLVRYVEAHGYPPTVREIGQEVGLASPSTVHAHLANLERAGMLRRDPTKPRALELLAPHRREATPEREPDVHRLPLVGRIAADEATVKRFFRENGRIRLQPENDALVPMYPEYVQVLGKVVGVFRMVV